MKTYIKTDSDNFIELAIPNHINIERLKYKNKFRKALFFLFNEGLSQTLKKHLGIQLEKKILGEQKIVVCKFAIDNQQCIGVGRQIYADKIKKFHPELVFKIKDDSQFKLADFHLDDATKIRLFAYLPFDESPLAKEIPRLILGQNLSLEPLNLKMSPALLWTPKKIVNENARPVFIYGFGAYARTYSLKFFKNNINSIIDYNKNTLSSFSKINKVSYFEDYRDSLSQYKAIENPIAIIATYHSSHFKIAKALFNANFRGKVFIEKPISVQFTDALELIKLKKSGFWCDAGYNRRYIDWNIAVKNMLEPISEPKIINISVKELKIPSWHWYFWPNQGTRITGNTCHWIDLGYFWIKCKPSEMALLNSDDSVSLGISFEDGSIVNIITSDKGNSLRGVQERIEIKAGDTTIFIDDYKKMIIYDNGRTIIKRKIFRDKGHNRMYKDFLKATKTNGKSKYADDDIFWVSYLIEMASKMLINKQRYVKVDMDMDTIPI